MRPPPTSTQTDTYSPYPTLFHVVHGDAIDGRKQVPPARSVNRLVLRHEAPHHGGRVRAQGRKMFRCEGRGGAHDIPPEADVRCAPGRQQMSTDRILDIEAPEQEFVVLYTEELICGDNGFVHLNLWFILNLKK